MKKMTTYRDFVGDLTVNYRRTKKPTVQITSSRVAADFIRPEFDHVMDDHEVAKVIHVNHENMIVNVHHVSSGTDTATLIPVKTIIRNAILIQTTGIILVHNHPSGQTKFSKADIAISKKIETACSYFDIRFLDSLVITRETYSSMKDEGVI